MRLQPLKFRLAGTSLLTVALMGSLVSVPLVVTVGIATESPASAACKSTVLLPGTSWLNGNGVDVYSNYPNQGVSNAGVACGTENYVNGVLSGYQWECVELVNRLYLTNGWIKSNWYGNGGGSMGMYNYVPSNLTKEPQGSISFVAPGDAVMFNVSGSTEGHVAIVNSVSGGSVQFVNQNFGTDASPQVYTNGTLSGGNLSISVSGMSVIGVVHAPTSSFAPSITNVSPSLAPVGTPITITGTNLSGATNVTFNGAAASIGTDSATQITTSVPTAGTTGNLSITTPGGTASRPFTVVQPPSWALIGADGNEEVYEIDSAGNLWQQWYTSGVGWSGWGEDLGAPTGSTLVGKPAVWVSPLTGNEEVFARDSGGHYWQKFWSGSWSGWLSLGSPTSPLVSDPVVLKGADGNEEVYGIDSAGNLWQQWWTPPGGPWSGWGENLGAPTGSALVGKPAVWVSPLTGNEEVFARDSEGQYWQKFWNGSWSSWTSLGSPTSPLVSDPVVLKGADGNEEVYGIDSAGNLWQQWWTPPGGPWSGWGENLGAPTGSTLVGKPAVWVSPLTGNEEVFARDSGGHYWQKFWNGSWSSWTSLGSPTSPLVSDPVVLKGADGNEEVYGIDSAGNLWQQWWTPPGGPWSGWGENLGTPSVPPAPTITSVSPKSGTTAGGTNVTITGTGFTSTTKVAFGTVAAATYNVVSATKITAVSPAEPAALRNIFVTNPGGTSTAVTADQFNFVTPPTVTSVSPKSGTTAGGTKVTITGTGFKGATKVAFGTVSATSFTVVSATQITAVSPAEPAALRNIFVTNPGGTSTAVTADQFNFVTPPTVTSVSPKSGTTAGGTKVTITGTGFKGATKVAFGTVSATSFTVVSATQITAVSPAEPAGLRNIFVTNPGGTSTAVTADQFNVQ